MRIWIIGGTSGIGAAIGAYCKSQGHEVSASGIKYDVKDYARLEDFWRQFGPFDAVVYSAGVNQLEWVADIDDKIAADIYDVNVLGFMRTLKLVQHQRENRLVGQCSSVLAISSDAGIRPMRTSMAYCASKAALNMAVQCAARELAPMRVNAIAPGMIEGTTMTAYIDAVVPEIRGWEPEHARTYETSQIPMGRRGQAGEVARIAYSVLLGPDYLTGSIVTINGGR